MVVVELKFFSFCEVEEAGEWSDSDFTPNRGGYGCRGGGGNGGGGGGYNANFGLQMFTAPGANMRGVGGNRYNPMRGGHGFANQQPPLGKQGGGGFNPTGFGRAAFSGARGMPARGGGGGFSTNLFTFSKGKVSSPKLPKLFILLFVFVSSA